MPDDSNIIEEVLGICDKLEVYNKKILKFSSDFSDLDVEYWDKRFNLLNDMISTSDDPKAVKSKIKADEEKLKLMGIKSLRNAVTKYEGLRRELITKLRDLSKICSDLDIQMVDAMPILVRYTNDVN